MKRRIYSLVLIVSIVLLIGRWLLIIKHDKMPLLDVWTRSPVYLLADSNVYDIASMFTWLVSALFLIPFTIIIGLLFVWWFRSINVGVIFAGGTLCSYIMNHFIKQLVVRERPLITPALNAEGYSFPSGHAMIATVCYGLLLFFLLKKIHQKKIAQLVRGFFLLLIILIGMSRYILNVHYLTDVIVGFILGSLILFIFIQLFCFLQNKNTNY